jgi:hypothetical protein
MSIISAVQEAQVRGFKANPRKKHETLSERWLKQKQVVTVAQMIECLPCKCETLSSNSNTTTLSP